jgi:hypothetical protein
MKVNIGKILVSTSGGKIKTMKKIIYVTLIVALAGLTTACRKSNVSRSSEGSTQTSTDVSLSDILKAGPWIIDYYVDEEDKSADFTGYVFTFKADSLLTLQKGNESYTGQWQVLKEGGVTKLLINVNTINIVQKLNDKWQLKNINSAKLDMRNDDPARSEFLNIKRV